MTDPDHLPVRRNLVEWALHALVMLVLAAILGYSLYVDHDRIAAAEVVRLELQARVVDEYLGTQLAAVNRALLGVRDDYPFGYRMTTGLAPSRRLKTLGEVMPSVHALFILDAKGTIVAANRDELIGRNFAWREYFRVPREHPDPARLYLSPPFRNVYGEFVVNLGRVAVEPTGQFAGVVSAALDPDYLDVVLRSVLYAPDMSVALIHGDGRVFLVSPRNEGALGWEAAAPGSLFLRHLESGQLSTTMTGSPFAAGEERLMVQRTFGRSDLAMDKPLVVGVSRRLAAIYAPWWRRAYEYSGGYALIALVTSLGLLFNQRRRRTLERMAAVRDVENRASAERIELALRGADLGLWDWHLPSGGLTCNDRWRMLHGYAGDAEPDFESWRHRVHPDDWPATQFALDRHLQGTTLTYEVEHRVRHPDGHWVWLLARGQVVERDPSDAPIRMVGTHMDITGRKQAEADLRIAATAFEAHEGMVVTDADTVILRVNRGFTEITGYTAAEAVGMTPRLLRSGRHDADFYAAMWESIRRDGGWQGEIWNRRKSGEVYPEWLNITAVVGARNELTHFVATLTDITRRKAAEDAIKHLAFYDPLTRLPNRRLLLDRLQQALAACARSGRLGAILFIDMDNFKTLNDTLGHEVGDQLLQEVARRLTTCVRPSDTVVRIGGTVARFGGDEYVVLLEGLSEIAQLAASEVENIGTRILIALARPYNLSGRDYHSSASVGITLFGSHGETVEELLKRADMAMYRAKAAGRNTLRFFDPDMQAAVSARAQLEFDLRQALRENQFVLHYQAQVRRDGEITGAEVLVRWQHPQRGLVPPAQFVPLAEETGLIHLLGRWVLEESCRQLAAWSATSATAALRLAVNISARQFRHQDFVAEVEGVLLETGADPHRLTLEFTESMLLDDTEDTVAKMTALKAVGVNFSLDDFGTGYSSLAYLKHLPLDQLKIDQSFVREVLTDPNDAAIARTIVALARSLGLAVIAEGVETQAQRDFLASHGCDAFQGYLFGRPGPAAELLPQRMPAACAA